MPSLLAAALAFARRGWPVLPLHHPVDGVCSCGRSDCPSPGKHPQTPNGLRDASTDPTIINQWWQRWPNANIGVATGSVSRIVVLDIDAGKGGLESWEELQDLHGRVDTLVCYTGGGGIHLYFEAPADIQLKSGSGEIAPGIDTRAEGGYVVAPPSLHISGQHYQWDGKEW